MYSGTVSCTDDKVLNLHLERRTKLVYDSSQRIFSQESEHVNTRESTDLNTNISLSDDFTSEGPSMD